MRKIGLVLVMFLCLGVGSLCCFDDTWATFYSDSNVSNRSSSTADSSPGYEHTNVTINEYVETTKTVYVGDTVSITFSNNIYSDEPYGDLGGRSVEWKVYRRVFVNGGGEQEYDTGGNSGQNYVLVMDSDEYGNTVRWWNSSMSYSPLVEGNVDRWESNSYRNPERVQSIASKSGNNTIPCIGSSRPYLDSNEANCFVHRDYYKVTFNKIGTYKFCEEMNLSDGGKGSKACSVIIVKERPEENICSRWTNAYNSLLNSNKNSGITSVVSRVMNVSIGSDYETEVYAKPSDAVKWIHCYYPGVQLVADSKAAVSHAAEGDNVCSSMHDYVAMKEKFGYWGNSFEVASTNLREPGKESRGNYREGTDALDKYNGGKYAVGDGFFKKDGNTILKESGIRFLIDDSYYVEHGSEKNKAGNTLSEKVTSSMPKEASVTDDGTHSWKCNPHQCCDDNGENCKTCYDEGEHTNAYLKGAATKESAKDQADVKVPYNFINTIDTLELSSGTVYAGETVTIKKAEVNIRTKDNNVTQGTYATQVDDAKLEFIAFVSSWDRSEDKIAREVGSGKEYNLCNDITDKEICNTIGVSDDETLNEDGVLGIRSTERTIVSTDSLMDKGLNGEYNVHDVSAGKYYCIVAAVYPANSGGDTNLKSSGSNSWFISNPKCAVVAKRPSLQVWGGSLYTAGKVVTKAAKKRVVSGKYSIQDFSGKDGDGAANSTDNTTVFGSWVEQSIIANGTVTGLASGAATGYNNLEHNESIRPLGGDLVGGHMSLCEYGVALTIPNSIINDMSGGFPGIKRCSSDSVGNTTSNKINEPTDKSALIQNFMGESSNYEYLTKYIRLRAFINDYNGKGLVMENSAAVITMGNRHTYVLHAKEGDSTVDFTIDQDIKYENGKYEDLFDIPKLIIYAKNINIECDVKRIDAVLIADNAVNTCSNANKGDVNSPERSNQLKINGTVIADRMITPRTYGAGTGAASVVSAEIVDYDTSLYLWGSQKAAASNSGRLGTAYQTELPPRY